MRRVETRYLDDGRGQNHGQPAALIEIERPDDLESLHRTIVETNYYGREYFEGRGYHEGTLIGHFWYLAEIARHLGPRRVLEVGCGRGDVLHLLDRAGVEVRGIDFSPAVVASAWPSLHGHLSCGDLVEVLDAHLRFQPHVRFDLVCGFDVWEHFPPARLDGYIQRAVDVSAEDALFFFVVPAFGDDRVFGEQFPLEFEENRGDFDRREPFRFLLSDADVAAVPAQGHLTWAHTEWWEQTFEGHGLVRLPEVERPFHQFLDDLVPHSIKAFYLFRRDTRAGDERAERLAARPYGNVDYTRTVGRLVLASRPLGPLNFDTAVRQDAVGKWRSRVKARARGTAELAVRHVGGAGAGR